MVIFSLLIKVKNFFFDIELFRFGPNYKVILILKIIRIIIKLKLL